MIDSFSLEGICDISPQVKAIEKYPSASIVRLTGDIGLEEITSIVRAVGMYRDSLREDIVLDLAEVAHIDAISLSMLVHVMERIKREQKDLFLAGCNALVRGHARIGAAGSVARICRTAEDALDIVKMKSA